LAKPSLSDDQSGDKKEHADNLNAGLEKCKGSYRNAVEIVKAMSAAGVNVKELSVVKNFIVNYRFEVDICRSIVKKVISLD